MIITLKGADFSNNNIGPLSSWLVSREIGEGARYSGPVYVRKGAAFIATVVLASGYRLNGEVAVTMGEENVSGAYEISEDKKTLTFSIAEVTGNISINVPTEYAQIYHTVTYAYLDEFGKAVKDPETVQVSDGTELYFDSEAIPVIKGWNFVSVNYTNLVVTDDVVIEFVYSNCLTFLGAEDFTDIGQRVQLSGTKWIDTRSGTTSAGTDFIPVSSEDEIWIEYVAVVNNTLGSGGFYDVNKQLVAPLYWGTFGIDQAATSSSKFVTPEAPVTIASVEEEFNCEIAYVRFTAWASADGNNTGNTTTEAKVYYTNGIPVEPIYTSYIGEDVFKLNKQSFTENGYTTSGSASAYATDYIEVTPDQGIWIQYVFTMNDAHRCVGFFDSNLTFIKSLTAADFGLELNGAFQTPAEPVRIRDIEGTENVAYVKFVAWATSNGGRANTEARIYTYDE